MSGMIHGGWEYVWAAYGITGSVFVLYTISVFARLAAERKRRELRR